MLRATCQRNLVNSGDLSNLVPPAVQTTASDLEEKTFCLPVSKCPDASHTNHVHCVMAGVAVV